MVGMNSTEALLDRVVSDLGEVVRAGAVAALSEVEKMNLLRAFGEAQRLLDAAVVETVASVDGGPAVSGVGTFPARFGCRNMNELLQRVLRVDAPGAARVVKAATLMHRETELTTGTPLPARWPALREALLAGAIGIPGLLAATGPIEQAGPRVGMADRLRADARLASLARGHEAADEADADAEGDADAELAPPASPEDLRVLAQVIVTYLDEDGAEPTDERAMRERFLTLGREKNGVVSLRGALLPDAAGQLQRLLDAYCSPRVDAPAHPGESGVVFHPTDADADADAVPSSESAADPTIDGPPAFIDPRTGAQKRHDALAAVLTIAARHDDVPTLGGAAPTLVVSVTAEDFAAGKGWAHVDGIETPVPVSVAAHAACAGGIQRVLFDPDGRIVSIGTTDRIFTHHQRRAIALRDKECVIPGCHVRSTWCEIHHVTDYAEGGPTHTDNGVPLCWYHHRTLDSSGWDIRMNNGLPEIRGPAWWDPTRRWRPPHPTRKPALVRRT